MAAQNDQVAQGAPKPETVPVAIDPEKQDASHKEFGTEILDNDKKRQTADYSGATKKTDPAEIKLVRKLDLWIMVSYSDTTDPHQYQPLTHSAHNSRRYGSCTGSTTSTETPLH